MTPTSREERKIAWEAIQLRLSHGRYCDCKGCTDIDAVTLTIHGSAGSDAAKPANTMEGAPANAPAIHGETGGEEALDLDSIKWNFVQGYYDFSFAERDIPKLMAEIQRLRAALASLQEPAK